MFRTFIIAAMAVVGATATPAQAFTEQDLNCLALNIYFEARNQPRLAKAAVGHVTMNRVAHKRFPDTVCGVIKQAVTWKGNVVRNKCQFSWWCDGRSDRPRNIKSWRAARLLARLILQHRINDKSDGAMWYHATYVKPYWRSDFTRVGQFGDHILYKVKVPT